MKRQGRMINVWPDGQIRLLQDRKSALQHCALARSFEADKCPVHVANISVKRRNVRSSIMRWEVGIEEFETAPACTVQRNKFFFESE
jgi:hypothetical protein